MSASNFTMWPVGGKLAIAIALPLFLTLLGYFLVLRPLGSDLIAARDEYNRLQAEFRSAQQRQEQYVNLQAQLARDRVKHERHKRTLPQQAEIPSFLQDLNRLAEINGLRIRLVEPRPEETAEMYIKIPVMLSLSGRYHQLAKFFDDISQLDRVITMEDIVLRNPNKEGSEEVMLEVDVRATTYRYDPSKITTGNDNNKPSTSTATSQERK